MATALAASVVAVVLLGLLGAPVAASPLRDPLPWEAGVRQLLDQRAAAVLSGDRDAFLATVDPGADGFRKAQAALFDGLASVRFASFRYDLVTDDIQDLSSGVRNRRGADEVRVPAVEVHYRIDGIDDVDAMESYWYTFVRRGHDWHLAADDDLADLGLHSFRNLWDFGPVSLLSGDGVAVLHDPSDRARAQALLDIAAAGRRRLVGSLDWPLPSRVLLVLPHSVDQLKEMLQATFDVSNFVAFATADVDRHGPDGWQWTAPRVYAQERNLRGHSIDFQVETLHHELFHVASFPNAGPFIPNWLHEGVADWLATGRPGSSRVAGTDRALPEDFEFVAGGSERILRSYRESVSAVAFLAGRRGADAPLRLFERLGAERVAPGTWRYRTDQALHEVYGDGLDAFEAGWGGGG